MLPGVQNKIKKTLWLIANNLYVSLMIKVKHFKKNSYICFSTRQDYYIMAKLKISNTEVEQLSNASAYIFPSTLLKLSIGQIKMHKEQDPK